MNQFNHKVTFYFLLLISIIIIDHLCYFITDKKKNQTKPSKLNAGNGKNDKEKMLKTALLTSTTLPCIHYWILNILGLKVLIQRLFECRFKKIYTKSLNIDNVSAFFNILKLLNNTEISQWSHERIALCVIDNEIVRMCLDPTATYGLVRDM